MPDKTGNVSVACAVDADGNVRAFFVDENDRLVVNRDIRSNLAVDGATQILKGGVVTNTSSVLYTVPAGYTFYLHDVALTGHNEDAAVQSSYLYLYDPVNVFVTGWKLSCGPSRGGGLPLHFDPPIEIEEGYYLKATSPVAGFALVVFLCGLLVS